MTSTTSSFKTGFAEGKGIFLWTLRRGRGILILNAVVKLLKKAVIDKVTLAVFLVVAVGSLLTDLSPVIFVVAAALAGIVARNVGGARK